MPRSIEFRHMRYETITPAGTEYVCLPAKDVAALQNTY